MEVGAERKALLRSRGRYSLQTLVLSEGSVLVGWNHGGRAPWRQAPHESGSVHTEDGTPGRQKRNGIQEGQAVAGAVWISRPLSPRANRCNRSRGTEYTCCSCCFLLYWIICPMSCCLEPGLKKELQRHWCWELFAFCHHCFLGYPSQSFYSKGRIKVIRVSNSWVFKAKIYTKNIQAKFSFFLFFSLV